MASEKQIQANRRNAKKSTGPRTAEGKAIVRNNALRHGARAKRLLLAGENPRELADLNRRMTEHFQPVGAMEEELVDKIVAPLWRQQWLSRVERGLFLVTRAAAAPEPDGRSTTELSDAELLEIIKQGSSLPVGAEPIGTGGSRASKKRKTAEEPMSDESLARAFLGSSSIENAFDRVDRYRTSADRAFYRAWNELERLQAARAGRVVKAPMGPGVVMDVEKSA